MKKFLAILLALAVVGAVSAQVTTAISLSGEVILYDQEGTATFARDGDGYDLLTFKATDKDKKYGFSITDQNVLDDGGIVVRDWNVWFQDGALKTSLGKLRNGTFRMTMPIGMMNGDVFSGSTNRISGYGALLEYKAMDGLTVGAGLEIPTAGADFVDVLKTLNLGAKYASGPLTAFALAELGLVADPQNSVFDLGATFTGVENMTATATARIGMGETTRIEFAAGAKYMVMDALTVGFEAGIESDDEFDWEASARAIYTVNDNITVQADLDMDSLEALDINVNLEYAFASGLTAFLNAGYSAEEVVYNVGLGYSVSF